jgi:site-specific DNA-adenine methylase
MGRPAKYDNPDDLIKAADAYFATCEDEERPITMSGLAYALGFTSRNSLYNYEEKPEFSVPIKRALLRIEQAYEERLSGSACTGAIFALKNRGWKDTQTHEDITTKPRKIEIELVEPSA